MLRRQYQIVLAATIILDLLAVLASWNAAYWLRFHVVNVPPAKMIVLPTSQIPGLVRLGVAQTEIEALEPILDKNFSNAYALRKSLSGRLSARSFDRVAASFDALTIQRVSIPPYADYARVNNFLIVLTLIAFRLLGVYRGVPFQKLRTEIASALKGGLLVLIITAATSFFYRDFEYSRVHMVYFVLVALILLPLGRIGLRRVLRALRSRGFLLRSFVLVGDSDLAAGFYQRWRRNPNIGLNFIGLVTLTRTIETPELKEIKHLGALPDLHEILERESPQLVISALTMNQAEYVPHVIEGLSRHLVDHKIVPALYGASSMHIEQEELDGIPIITVTQSPLEGWSLVNKRMIDIVGSLVAMLLFAPFFLLISAMIRATSPGPIFFKQERMGWNGRNFDMLKFRSMPVDVESASGAVWAEREDQRSTFIGRVIRRTSLDELPQLLNVLKGEMSLVGPRPERPVFIDNFRSQIPHYMLRHKIKAGMTGWAQINGWRGNTSLEKRIEFDLYYISHWSIAFDFRILFLTLFKGFIHPNAY